MVLPGNFRRIFNLIKLPSPKWLAFNSLCFGIFWKVARVNTRFYLARGTSNMRNAFLLCHNLNIWLILSLLAVSMNQHLRPCNPLFKIYKFLLHLILPNRKSTRFDNISHFISNFSCSIDRRIPFNCT